MRTTISVFHWLPRILCILAILFISMFSLDSFSPTLTFWQQLGGFIIHLIPTYVLVALLFIAWKWEMAGGIIFTIIGLVMSPFIYQHNYNVNHSVETSLSIILLITFPFIAVGVLFIVSDILKKRQLAH